jgi:N6-L-threonylcarbamoyladenine synthase
VIDVLVAKSFLALKKTGHSRLAVGGGVTANTPLRTALEERANREGIDLIIPPLNLCTDNAAMAALAIEKYRRGQFAPLDLDAQATLL